MRVETTMALDHIEVVNRRRSSVYRRHVRHYRESNRWAWRCGLGWLLVQGCHGTSQPTASPLPPLPQGNGDGSLPDKAPIDWFWNQPSRASLDAASTTRPSPRMRPYRLDNEEQERVTRQSPVLWHDVGREWNVWGTSMECNEPPRRRSGACSYAATTRSESPRDDVTKDASETMETSNHLDRTSRPRQSFDTPSFGQRSGSAPSHHRRPSNRSSGTSGSTSFFQPVTEWWSTHVGGKHSHRWPKIQCRIEPTTTLKIRKTFRPLHTILKLSAQFNTQLGVWQFHTSWEDAIIGGKLTLAGRKELQLTKSWTLSVGGPGLVEDLVTRLRLRAAVDLQTWKAYVRVGFRTERLSPINVMEGFALVQQIPLDGVNGKVKLEVKANFALPEPEIEYSTETHRSLVGMGDVEVSIDELNLLLDY